LQVLGLIVPICLATKEYIEEKAKRGSWEKFQQVLNKVPDVEPWHNVYFDRLGWCVIASSPTPINSGRHGKDESAIAF